MEKYDADVTRLLIADPKARLDANHPLWKFLVGVGVPEANANMAVKEAIDVESKEETDSDNHKMPFIPNDSCCHLK